MYSGYIIYSTYRAHYCYNNIYTVHTSFGFGENVRPSRVGTCKRGICVYTSGLLLFTARGRPPRDRSDRLKISRGIPIIVFVSISNEIDIRWRQEYIHNIIRRRFAGKLWQYNLKTLYIVTILYYLYNNIMLSIFRIDTTLQRCNVRFQSEVKLVPNSLEWCIL